MKHKIIEKKVSPELWNRPIPICPEEIPHLGKEDYEQRLERLWNMPMATENIIPISNILQAMIPDGKRVYSSCQKGENLLY